MVRYVEKKVKIKPKLKFDGLFPTFSRGRTITITIPIKEEGDKMDTKSRSRQYGLYS